jgi:hypothetical protein
MAIICDVCKQDPVVLAKTEAEKLSPWGMVAQPPASMGLPTMSICWRCWYKLLEALMGLVEGRLTPSRKGAESGKGTERG